MTVKVQGFTMLELLLVCAIISILGAVGFVTFRGAIDRARVSEAAAQVAADLQRARSASQRFNQSSAFRVASANARDYTLTIGGQSNTRTLPVGTQFVAATTISYTAPFGETGGTNSVLNVRLQNRTTGTRGVRVLGVTGKVYLQ